MKIFVISHLFPSRYHPRLGLFVFERVRHMADIAEVSVCVPVKLSVLLSFLVPHANPRRDEQPTLRMHCPPYLSLPPLHFLSGLLMAMCLLLDTRTRRCLRDCDVVDVHWTYPDAVAGWILARIYRKRIVVTLRGVEALYRQQGWLREKILRATLARMDGIISVSQQLADMTSKLGQDVSAPLRAVVANGVDTERFSPGNRHRARHELGLSDGQTAVISVGRVSPGKGFHHLIAAWPRIIAEMPDAVLHILGDPDPDGGRTYLQELEAQAQALGVADSVTFAGGQSPERLVTWYRAGDLFALATASEGSPNVVLEALACGLPVLVTDVGGVREIVRSEELGLLMEKQDDDWAPMMLDALKRSWDRAHIRAQIESRTWADCARQATDFLAEVVRHRDPCCAETPTP